MKLIGMLSITPILDFIVLFHRMLDTGFEPDIRKLEDLGLPQKDERITSMFSATFPDEVQRLAKHFLRNDYVFLAVGILGGANEDISQTIELVPQGEKKDRLFQLLEENLSKTNKTKIEFFCFFLKKLNVV
jgi:superfamily II DNA/RNA helicase